MANNIIYFTAGLPCIDSSDSDPANNTYYWSAGLPPTDKAAAGPTGTGQTRVPAARVAAAGVIKHTGTANIEISAAKMASSGKIGHIGVARITIPSVRVEAAGSLSGQITGVARITVGSVKSGASGKIAHTGIGRINLPTAQAEASGAIAGQITGIGNIEIAALRVGGSGKISHTGSGVIEITAVRAGSSGKIKHVGIARISITTVTASGSGSLSGSIAGEATVRTAAVVVSATGVIKHTGVARITVGSAQISGSGVVNTTITGYGNIEISGMQTSGAGVLGTEISGVGKGRVAAARVSGIGTIDNDTPVFWRIVRKLQTLISGMTTATGYSQNYGTIDEYRHDYINYPAVYMDYADEIDTAESLEVAEQEYVSRVIKIKVLTATSADLDKTVCRIYADFNKLLADHRNTLRKRGMIKYDVVKTFGEYNNTAAYPIYANIEINILYRRVRNAPYTNEFNSTAADSPAVVPFAEQTPIFINIANSLKTLLGNLTIANGYAYNYGSIDEYDPSSITYPAIEFTYSPDIYIPERSEYTGLGYYNVYTSIELCITGVTNIYIDKECMKIIADIQKMFRNELPQLQSAGMSEYRYTGSKIKYQLIAGYPFILLLNYDLYYRMSKNDLYST